MDNTKKKKYCFLVIEFIIIALCIVGVTYAIYVIGNKVNIKIKEVGIDTSIYGETKIDTSTITLEPINDSTITTNTDNVIKIEFNVVGDKNNLANNVIYDIALVDLNIDCELLSKYLKWKLIMNDEEISNGSFDYEFDTIINNRLVLTNTELDLKKYGEEPDKFVFYVWLSDSCDNLMNCSKDDNQNNLMNHSLSGKIEVELNTGTKTNLTRNPNSKIDYNSCINNIDKNANKPVMDTNMVPVYYDNGEMFVADKNNSNKKYLWYNYENQKWANVILVKDTVKYKKLGTKIDESDIEGVYVWIPRYKYQVWNIDNSNTNLNEINIIFESGTNNSGEISCVETCAGNNGEYYVNESFKDKTGFWISKYLLKDEENVKSISNDDYIKNKSLKEIDTYISKIDTNLKNKLIDNLEYGAAMYLMYSKYGLCRDNTCDIKNTNETLIYDLDKDEIVKFNKNTLGGALIELGSDINKDNLYYNNLLSPTISSDNYGFRNVLSK